MVTGPHQVRLSMKMKGKIDWMRWMRWSIWISGAISMLTMTMYDFIPLLSDYKDEEKNIATQASIVKNRSIPHPNPVVCLPYYSDAMESIDAWLNQRSVGNRASNYYEAMKDHSWTDDIWDFNVSDYYEMIDTAKGKIVQRVVEDRNRSDLMTLASEDFNWNQPIVDAVWEYVRRISALDRDLTPPLRYSINDSIHSKVLIGSKWTINPASNEIIDQLFERLVRAMLDIHGNLGSSSTKVGLSAMTIFNDHLCIQTYSNRTESDAIEDEARGSGEGAQYLFRYPKPRRFSVKTAYLVQDPSLLYSNNYYMDTQGNWDVIPLYETESTNSEGILAEQVTLTYSLEARFTENRTGKACSTENTPSICIAKRHSKRIMRYCNCIPFTYRFLQDNPMNLPYCMITHYDRCREKLPEEEMGEDVEYCNEKCTHVLYKWKPTSTIDETKDNFTYRSFYLEMRPLHGTPYVEFMSVDKITSQQFFASLGGIISLYLGFSGMTVFVAIVMCLNFVIRRYLQRKSSGSKLTDHNNGSNVWTLLLWTRNFLHIWAGNAQQNNPQPNVDEDTIRQIRNRLNDELDKKIVKISQEIRNELKEMKLEIIQMMKNEMNQMKSDNYRESYYT